MRRVSALFALIAATFWLAADPAWAQSATRVIETVPAPGAAAKVARISDVQPSHVELQGPPRRVALVIGNSAYQSAPPLLNPANDSKAVARRLADAGFEVVSAADLTHDEMRRVIDEFAARIAERGPNTVALVFYAGHGVQLDGENFLVPVDARIERTDHVADQTVRLFDLMKTLESVPSRMRIVILDACRNNPFASLGDADGKGFAIVDAPAGSIVAYSTAPGTEALDGDGRHSPYAAAFLRVSKTPGLPIEQMFKRVRRLVHEATDSRQTPWESSSLTLDFMLFPPANANTANAAPRPKVSRLAEVRTRPVLEAYEIVIEEDSIEYYEEFVRFYPAHPLCERIRWLLLRRLQMIAWYNAVLANSHAAYKTYLAHFPDSEHAAAARRLQERPRAMPLPLKDPIVTRPLPIPPIGEVKPLPVPPKGDVKPLPVPPVTEIKPLPIPSKGDVKPLPVSPIGEVKPLPIPSKGDVKPLPVSPIGEVKPPPIPSKGDVKPLPVSPIGSIVTRPLLVPPIGQVKPLPVPTKIEVKPLPAKDSSINKPIDRIVTLPPRQVDVVVKRPVPSDRVTNRPELPDFNPVKKVPVTPVIEKRFERPVAMPVSPPQRPLLGRRESAGCRIINEQRVCGRS